MKESGQQSCYTLLTLTRYLVYYYTARNIIVAVVSQIDITLFVRYTYNILFYLYVDIYIYIGVGICTAEALLIVIRRHGFWTIIITIMINDNDDDVLFSRVRRV